MGALGGLCLWLCKLEYLNQNLLWVLLWPFSSTCLSLICCIRHAVPEVYFVMLKQALCTVWIIWRKILIGCNQNWNPSSKVCILCLYFKIFNFVGSINDNFVLFYIFCIMSSFVVSRNWSLSLSLFFFELSFTCFQFFKLVYWTIIKCCDAMLLNDVINFADHYLLFDFPGQVELFFLHSNAKTVIMKLIKKLNLRVRLCLLHLDDIWYLSGPWTAELISSSCVSMFNYKNLIGFFILCSWLQCI